jgi:TRAP-type C4-dicarboxylate transport system substrate-binding protein
MCIVATIFLLAGSFNAAFAAAPAPIELKFVYPYTNVSAIGRSMEYFASLVMQRSQGRVKITTYPSNTLLPAERIYEGIVAGVADIGNVSPHYVATRFPANDATMLPLPIKDGWSASYAVNDWFHHFKPKEFDDVHMFMVASCGPFALQFRDKPIAKLADAKGVKIRAAGVQAGAFVRALGATPVNMPMAEAFEAVSRGVVDGLLAPTESLKAWKHADVVKYVTRLPISFAAPNNTFMNLNKWNSLPADIKKVFNDVVAEALEAEARAWHYGDLVGQEYFLSQAGRKFVELPAAEIPECEKMVAPIRDAYIAQHKNLPGAEYIKYLGERMNYWAGRTPDKKVVIEFVEKELLKSK